MFKHCTLSNIWCGEVLWMCSYESLNISEKCRKQHSVPSQRPRKINLLPSNRGSIHWWSPEPVQSPHEIHETCPKASFSRIRQWIMIAQIRLIISNINSSKSSKNLPRQVAELYDACKYGIVAHVSKGRLRQQLRGYGWWHRIAYTLLLNYAS